MFSFRTFFSYLLLAGLLASSPLLQAGLRLELDQRQLSPAQRQASHALLAEAAATLPSSLIEQMSHTVTVRWSTRLPDSVFGRATPGGTLELNQRWLDDLVAGSEGGFPEGRQHRTLRRELLATLVHEVAHLYDRGRYWSNEQRTLLRQCRSRFRTQGKAGLPGECLGQTERRFTLSDAPRFLDLAGWPQQVGRRGAREAMNRQTYRSPDDYERFSPAEYLAVNLEYFLLDPQYHCRRPALHAYFAAHFGWAPDVDTACPTTIPYLRAGLDTRQPALGWLDPERIYAVHYLLAEPNEQWVSRWGHSMLRLVICAPGRPLGPDCMLDLDHHLVLSFRAFVDDLQLSSWDGLIGNYPSRLFILPLQKVIDEYTQIELRGLSSVPLRLDEQARYQLAQQAAALHWSYDGTYYFISNNCAVETLKLLRTGSAERAMQDLDSLTPRGLLRLLASRGLADMEPLQDRQAALRQGYYFDSYEERYRHMFSVLRTQLQIPAEHMEDWFATDAQTRRGWFAEADTRTTAALLVLEEAIRRRQALEIQQDLKLRLLSPSAPPELAEAAHDMEGILAGSSFLSRPGELLREGYGLPQPEEARRFTDLADARHQALRTNADQLEQRLLAMIDPRQRRQLEATTDNLQLLGEQLRQLHGESGGVQLP